MTRQIGSWAVGVLAGLLMTAPALAQHVGPAADSAAASVPRLLALAGPNVTTAAWLRPTMRQVDGAQSRARLDEIADSLVARVLAQRSPQDTARARYANDARAALALVGMRAGPEGQPYDGTLSRLVRIHQESAVPAVRASALTLFPYLAGTAGALEYLRAVAASSDETAYAALTALMWQAEGIAGGVAIPAEARAAAASVLDTLATHTTVVSPRVAEELRSWRSTRRSRR
jgi:hypothetical protein